MAEPSRPPRLDRRRLEDRWRRVALGIGVAMVAIWALLHWLYDLGYPNDPVGVAFGVAATLLMSAVAAYGLRRRAMSLATRLGLGSAPRWLALHLYGGWLFLVAMFLHSGLQWPDGAFSWCLWLLSVWTVLTGALGLMLQRTVPRLLAAGASVEVHYDRIPALVEDLRRRAEALVAAADRPVQVLYRRRLAPVLAAPRRNPAVFLDADGGRRRLEPVARLRSLLEPDERERLAELEELVRAKLDLDTHFTLQQVLRGWLWLHLPASILLVVLVIVHIASVAYYGGFAP
ncbi:MAG: hypothetical protein AAGE94_03765 [Acidobacteriota bacterium]